LLKKNIPSEYSPIEVKYRAGFVLGLIRKKET
jgi:hypothetical protein